MTALPFDHAQQLLLALQQRIHAFTLDSAAEHELDIQDPADPLWAALQERVTVAPLYGGLHVEFFGNPWEEPFAWTLACLSDQRVADAIMSLSFTGPDEGANGTREWEFTALLDSDVRFPRLRSLSISPTEPADHNMSLVQRAGTIMEEDGEIARFVSKAPYLSELVVPNAPDAAFFEVPLPHLHSLRIGGGSDTQRFIDNLVASRNLPALGLLDFSESTELQFTWADAREPDAVTPFAVYERLFASDAFDALHTFRLRNSALALEQLQSLQVMRPRLSFMVIQAATGGYVSHFAKDGFPWRHLVPGDPGQR
ncbi:MULTISPECIES: hypothetical protein [Stenotrophomonas]|uniref:hypothetical protein n=1 Tax=Stenotrophomonas TaxID=40323 RepID=UPI000B74870B|nr:MULTISPECIES: hypothetical protein [Stenotrophomonas]SMR83986.1 hypothetical protein SAMN04487863_4239 [Stenotrophomonas sp. yr243]SNT66399.1 hypothetical protein SAMN05518671_3981 [Stenotrophomonas lactitubi]